MSVYCDYNAGAPVRPEAAQAAAAALAIGGNPSSVHARGRRARACVESAREDLGAALGAPAQDIVFTSGATEALHLAVDGARAADPGLVFLRSAIEHDALAELSCDGIFRVDADGVVDLDHLEEVLRAARGRALVALMAVNNETGAVQPMRAARDLIRRYDGLLLCDAAQAFGRIYLNAGDLGADYLVISSHKIAGPPGAGALVLAGGAPFVCPRRGGGQERGRRPGTENIAAIAGFAAAAQIAGDDWAGEAMRLTALRDGFERALRAAAPEIEIVAARTTRAPNTSLFVLPGMPAETAVIALDLNGVCVSAGAACSSGKVKRSRVLEAMGAPTAHQVGAVRASFGWASTPADGEALVAAFARIAKTAYALAREV